MILINDDGFFKNSLEENIVYVEDIIKGEKGQDVDLSPTGPWGQISAILTKLVSDIDDQQEEIYLSRDPDNATGVSQNKLSAETGTFRRGATATFIQDVLLNVDEGKTIPSGSRATLEDKFEPAEDLSYELDEDVTVNRSTLRKLLLSLDEPETGTTYEITLNSVLYSYVALVADTIPTVITAFSALLPAEVVGSNQDDDLSIVGDDQDFTIGASTPSFTVEELWGVGNFTANLKGKNEVPSTSLTVIVTPVSGWNAVINPNAGVTGLNIESDAELIIRRKNELIKGKATDAAIENAVRNALNVTSVKVISNRTDAVVDDIPAHGFETIVTSGDDDAIAQAIFDTMPTGIEPYGDGSSGTAVDEDGQEFIIPFSRPTSTYIWLKYIRTQHPEVAYPDDGDERVKTATVDFSSAFVVAGTDVVRQVFGTPFFSVPGSSAVTIEIAETATPEGTPTWTTVDLIAISGGEKAEFSADRVFVETP